MFKEIKKTISLPDGREITIATGKLAKQADGAVEVRMGSNAIIVVAEVITAGLILRYPASTTAALSPSRLSVFRRKKL